MAIIYKIENPKNKIYIGQTTNYKLRINYYKNLKCKNQIRLYNSLVKYGFDKHKIEIVAVCLNEDLNDLERYYQDLFKVTGRMGLNIRLTKSKDRSGQFSEESKKKMSIAKIGNKRSEEVKKSISDKMKLIASQRDKSYYSNFSKCNQGRIHSEEHILKNSNSKKGNTFRRGSTQSEETKLKISNSKRNGTKHK